MDRIEDLVANLSAAEAKNILKLVEELDRRDREGGAISTFVANPKQKEIFNTKKKVRTVMGGNRCLGGEQQIYDPVACIWRRVDQIVEPFHVWAWDFNNRERVVAMAEIPFKKLPADLYRVEFKHSPPMIVSGSHLFWSCGSWFEAIDIVYRDVKYIISPGEEFNDVVTSVEFIRKDTVWDFEVGVYHNYMVGNIISHNSGKSHCAAFEVACHATGIYPDWWEGYRYTEAIDMGVISPDTGQMLKTSQRKLMGPPDSFGTGFIPKELILELHERPQTNGCLDFALIKHASGGTTRMYFMTTQQTLKSFMGFMWRLAWFDEEPPWEYFDETRFRMLDKGGNILLSFYPPEGQTELISFLEEMEKKNPEYYESWFLEWADNPTLDPETVEMMEKTTPDWLKESRKYGRTGAGEGRCFPYSRDIYVCDPFEIERHWRQIAGLDVGFGHYTAAVCVAFDDMSDTAYVYKEYFSKEQLPAVHASALRRWGDVEFCIDTSSNRRSPTDGKRLFQMYAEEGLKLRDAETRGGTVESSIALINTMLSERRLFIFATCPNLIRQMGGYRRVQDKQGKWSVLAKDNDIIDGFRYSMMWLNEARVPGTPRMGPPTPRIVEWAPVDARIGI